MGTDDLYLYGITNSFCDPVRFMELKELGLDIVQYEKISAIVGKRAYVNLAHAGKETLARLLLGHQQTLEKLMEAGYSMLIPVRLGTWLKDRNDIRKILEKAYRLCTEILSKTGNKVEIDVVATWGSFVRVLQDISVDPEVFELKQKLMAQGDSIPISDQMQMGKLVKAKLDEKADAIRQRIVKSLDPCYQELKCHELMQDQMVANIAFLVNKGKLDAFEQKLDRLDQELKGELNFRCVGPLPCYSFYTLEIVELSFEQIEQAKNELGINLKASSGEIRQAYLCKVKSVHPDVNSGDGNETYFKTLHRAYHVINEYLQTVRQSSDEDLFYFTREQVEENSLLIKIKD
ncbi:MAG: GvpL/GvpF family gas vesicle protein [Mangrovibacterium sp.]